MERKALFFDIDGTLLGEKSRKIPESAAEALRKAREKGHLVFINSGRARCLMQDVEESGIPVDGYLCGCGTYLEIGGKKVLHNTVPAGRRLEIQKAIISHRLEGVLEGMEACCAREGVSPLESVERMKNSLRRRGVLITDDWEKAADFDKFCVEVVEESDIDGFLKFLEPDFAAIDRGHGLYECVPAGFNKAAAMEFILRYFDIPWEQSYAFGDSSNDLAMIRYACNSVIMGKHDAVLEPYATFVTKTVEEDGIAYAFEALAIL